MTIESIYFTSDIGLHVQRTVEKLAVPGVPEFYPELFHRLPEDLFRAIIGRLKSMFIHANSPVARWSVSVATSANSAKLFAPPPPEDHWGR